MMKLKPITFLVTIMFLFISTAFSQYGKKKSDFYGSKFRATPLYKYQGFYKLTGFHFTAGATYNMTRTKPLETTYSNQTGDTSLNQSLMPRGKLGYYVKVGALHIFRKKRKVFHYIDYGIGVKHFGGIEEFNADLIINRAGVINSSVIEGKGNFDLGYAFLDFNINNVIQISEYNWIQNSIGFNLDYQIYGGGQYSGAMSTAPQDYQQKFKADIHYKLGLGIKLVKGMYLVPAIETPIFTAFGWRNGHPSIHWFGSTYQPLIVSLTFAFLLKKNPEDCPPVYSPGDQNRSDSYQNTRK